MGEILAPDILAVLGPALALAFKDRQGALKQACDSTAIGIVYDIDVTLGQDFGSQVRDLLLRFNNDGAVDLLLIASLKARLGDAVLRKAVLDIRPLLREAVPDEHHAIAAALEALRSQLDSPDVRDLVATSRYDLKEMAETLALLAAYKGLHDCLHRIQMALPILFGPRRNYQVLPWGTDGDWAILEASLPVLDDPLTKAAAIAEGVEAGRRNQEKRCVEDFQTAVADLNTAGKARDAVLAGDAYIELRRLLRHHHPRLDFLLSDAARNLPLDNVVAVFQKVIAALPAGDPLAAKVQGGLGGLQTLQPEILRHVEEHDDWQVVDGLLWEAETALETQHLDAVRASWRRLRERLQALCGAPPAAWAGDVLAATDAIAVSLPTAAPDEGSALSQHFTSLLRASRRRFFQVDLELNERLGRADKLRPTLNELLNDVRLV